MPGSLADTLAALTRAFSGLDVAWYLFGAQAALLRGSRRMTADIDVTVFADALDVGRLLDVLEQEAIRPRWALDDAFVRQSRVLPLMHDSVMPVDVVLGSAGLDEYFLERAETLDIDGVRVRVPLREDLVCMKLLAGRPHDLQDAAAMIRAGPCDLDEVRAFIEGMAEALGETEPLATLDALLGGLGGPA